MQGHTWRWLGVKICTGAYRKQRAVPYLTEGMDGVLNVKFTSAKRREILNGRNKHGTAYRR